MESTDSASDDFVQEFYIPDYLLVPGKKGEYLRHIPECPVVVFINSRSGGQLGGDLLITYRSILNPNQVCHIMHVLSEGATLSKFNEDMSSLCPQYSLCANFH